MSWQIDSAHSSVEFTVRHMMVTNVRGRFDNFTADVNFDEQNPAATTVNVEIQADSINTNMKDRDAHLRSGDFFDVENYPVLTYKSRRVEVVDGNHARLIGDLTIRDITREVALDVDYAGQVKSPFGKTVAAFTAQTRISRKDWGLTWNVGLETGGFLVGDDITINIELELVKQEVAETETAANA